MAKDTYIPRNELVDMNAEMNRVLERVKPELMKIPGVMDVGLGLKQTKGEFKRQLCIVVCVSQKRGTETIPPAERIPDSIEGFPTDVREIVNGEATLDTRKYRPLIGGSQIQINKASGSGTMGCLAITTAANALGAGKIVALSNWHVMVSTAAAINGEKVGQPTHNGCCSCCECNEIGAVVDGKFAAATQMDAAIALLNGQSADTVPDEKYLQEVLQIGLLAGSAAHLAGETLSKYGRTTEYTRGQVTNTSIFVTTSYANQYGAGVSVGRAGQLEVGLIPGFPRFTDLGDSGSVYVNEHNQVVGLHHTTNTTSWLSWGTPIALVLAAPPAGLGITIPDTTFHPGTSKSGIPLRTDARPQIPSLTQAFAELDAELSQYPEGQRMMALFSQHRAEMMSLVNHNREVKAAWNRYHGPEHLAHLARTLQRKDKPLPPNVKGITLQNLVIKMAAVLQRNGSPTLTQAVNENYLQVMGVLDAGNSPDAWREYLRQTQQHLKTTDA
jgi:hypothetical protein